MTVDINNEISEAADLEVQANYLAGLEDLKTNFREFSHRNLKKFDWSIAEKALLQNPALLEKLIELNHFGHKMVLAKVNTTDAKLVFISAWTQFDQIAPEHKDLVFEEAGRLVEPTATASAEGICQEIGAKLAAESTIQQLGLRPDAPAWIKSRKYMRKLSYKTYHNGQPTRFSGSKAPVACQHLPNGHFDDAVNTTNYKGVSLRVSIEVPYDPVQKNRSTTNREFRRLFPEFNEVES